MKLILQYWWNLRDAKPESEKEKCDYVIAKYLFSLSLILPLIYWSLRIADVLNKCFPLTETVLTYFQTGSVAIAAIGIWGHNGCEMLSWREESKAEKLNLRIAQIFSLLGFVLSIISFHLIPV